MKKLTAKGSVLRGNQHTLLTGLMEGPNAIYTQRQFLAAVAQLELTQLRVGLVGLQATGIAFA